MDWVLFTDEDEEDIKLTSLGSAFSIIETKTDVGRHHYLMTPEEVFEGWYEYRADLWRVGCVVSRNIAHLLLVLN